MAGSEVRLGRWARTGSVHGKGLEDVRWVIGSPASSVHRIFDVSAIFFLHCSKTKDIPRSSIHSISTGPNDKTAVACVVSDCCCCVSLKHLQ